MCIGNQIISDTINRCEIKQGATKAYSSWSAWVCTRQLLVSGNLGDGRTGRESRVLQSKSITWLSWCDHSMGIFASRYSPERWSIAIVAYSQQTNPSRELGGVSSVHREVHIYASSSSRSLSSLIEVMIYRDGDVVVEFCAGSGYVALPMACLFPTCTFILLDMKQRSLDIGIYKYHTDRQANLLT
jgi:hypothetical protein